MSTYEEREALAATARAVCAEYLRANGYPDLQIVEPDAFDIGRPLLKAGGATVDIQGVWKKPDGRIEVHVSCREGAAPHITAAGLRPGELMEHRDGRDELRRLIPDYRRYESFSGVPHARLWKRVAAAIVTTTAELEGWRTITLPAQIGAALAEDAAQNRFHAIARHLGGWIRAGELRGIDRARANRIAEAMGLVIE